MFGSGFLVLPESVLVCSHVCSFSRHYPYPGWSLSECRLDRTHCTGPLCRVFTLTHRILLAARMDRHAQLRSRLLFAQIICAEMSARFPVYLDI